MTTKREYHMFAANIRARISHISFVCRGSPSVPAGLPQTAWPPLPQNIRDMTEHQLTLQNGTHLESRPPVHLHTTLAHEAPGSLWPELCHIHSDVECPWHGTAGERTLREGLGLPAPHQRDVPRGSSSTKTETDLWFLGSIK